MPSIKAAVAEEEEGLRSCIETSVASDAVLVDGEGWPSRRIGLSVAESLHRIDSSVAGWVSSR
jgi:hypothetical protein